MHWTSDGFAYLYQWIYSCRTAGQFTSNFWGCACLTMPSLSGITIYRNTLRPFWTPDIFCPSFRSHFLSSWVQICMTVRPTPLSYFVLVSGHLDPLTFSLSFFKESKALLASTIIFLILLFCYANSWSDISWPNDTDLCHEVIIMYISRSSDFALYFGRL